MKAKISNNFDLHEFSKLYDSLPAEIIVNLTYLVSRVLQPLRDALDVPITVSSGYRDYIRNKKVGGSSTSQHLSGQAADLIFPSSNDLLKAINIIKNQLPFDQLIYYKHRNFIHVSYRGYSSNRKQYIVQE